MEINDFIPNLNQPKKEDSQISYGEILKEDYQENNSFLLDQNSEKIMDPILNFLEKDIVEKNKDLKEKSPFLTRQKQLNCSCVHADEKTHLERISSLNFPKQFETNFIEIPLDVDNLPDKVDIRDPDCFPDLKYKNLPTTTETFVIYTNMNFDLQAMYDNLPLLDMDIPLSENSSSGNDNPYLKNNSPNSSKIKHFNKTEINVPRNSIFGVQWKTTLKGKWLFHFRKHKTHWCTFCRPYNDKNRKTKKSTIFEYLLPCPNKTDEWELMYYCILCCRSYKPTSIKKINYFLNQLTVSISVERNQFNNERKEKNESTDSSINHHTINSKDYKKKFFDSESENIIQETHINNTKTTTHRRNNIDLLENDQYDTHFNQRHENENVKSQLINIMFFKGRGSIKIAGGKCKTEIENILVFLLQFCNKHIPKSLSLKDNNDTPEGYKNNGIFIFSSVMKNYTFCLGFDIDRCKLNLIMNSEEYKKHIFMSMFNSTLQTNVNIKMYLGKTNPKYDMIIMNFDQNTYTTGTIDKLLFKVEKKKEPEHYITFIVFSSSEIIFSGYYDDFVMEKIFDYFISLINTRKSEIIIKPKECNVNQAKKLLGL